MTPVDPTEPDQPGRPRIGRRALIAGGIALVGAGAVGVRLVPSDDGSTSPGDGSADRPEPIPADRVAPTADRVARIQALGARYRRLAPAATTAEALSALPAISSVDDVEAAFERDRALIRDDYAQGRVVVIDGWRFSEREALLAAQASAVTGR